MGAFLQRALFVFDAAACAAVWALVIAALIRGEAPPSLGWSAILPATGFFAGGFALGGVAGALALRRLEPARLTQGLYVVVGAFVVGMVVLKALASVGISAF